MMYKYAIIGKGFIFSRHVEAIELTGGKVVLTCDIDTTKGADFLDYREMLDSPKMKEVDVVVICTPNHLHAEMVRDVLHIGKTVLCEKPLTINTDFSGMEGVNVVQQLHYHPLFDTICQKLRKAKKVKEVTTPLALETLSGSTISGIIPYFDGPNKELWEAMRKSKPKRAIEELK